MVRYHNPSLHYFHHIIIFGLIFIILYYGRGSVEQLVSTQVKDQFNAEAMKLGLRGVTIVASSG